MMQLLIMVLKEIVPYAVVTYGLPVYIQILQSFQHFQHNLAGMGLRLHEGKRAREQNQNHTTDRQPNPQINLQAIFSKNSESFYKMSTLYNYTT
jgi:hypothetical protein